MRWLFRVSFITAFAATIWAGIDFIQSDTGLVQHSFIVNQVNFELPDISPGRHELIIPITNSTSVPRKIVGIHETCDINCCYWSSHKGVITVSPGQTFEYAVLLDVYGKGQFEANIRIFLEEKGIRTVVIHATGMADDEVQGPK